MGDDGFRNRHERFNYLVACETARRILADPGIIEHGRAHLERFAAVDPRQSAAYALWSNLLAQGPETVARTLVARSEAADYARQTAPAFGGLPARVRADLLRRAQEPLDWQPSPHGANDETRRAP